MPQYLVCNYLPDYFDPATVTEAMMEEIHALNRELIAAGVRKFACGISPARNPKTLQKEPDGKVLVTDGPYTETKEHMGGFRILEAADLDEALAWAKKAAIACDVPGDVRELFSTRLRNKDRRKQVNNLATAASEHAPQGRNERTGATVPLIRYEGKNNEIHLFGVLRQGQI